jgi:hypothetical protein
LPGRYKGAAPLGFSEDAARNYDQFARTALETYRHSYQPGPTSNSAEFGRFFSGTNFAYLVNQTKEATGWMPDKEEVMDAMMYAFQMVQPRSDLYDERSSQFTESAVQSYMREMNKLALERIISETDASNNLWEGYEARFLRHEIPMEDTNIATDTKGKACTYAMDYWLP